MSDLVQLTPPFTTRLSRGQKHLRLRITADQGLVVSGPDWLSNEQINEWVEEHLGWIYQQAERLGIDLHQPAQARAIVLPDVLELRAFAKSLNVFQDPLACHSVVGHIDSEWVQLPGALSPEQSVEQLKQWLMRAVKPLFQQWLDQLSSKTQLPYQKLTIRAQRSRWGSYSRQGAVSLNVRVAFLPPALAEYVLLHELAHSRHFDHSPAFWQLLSSICSDAKFKDRQLNQAQIYLPDWLG